MQFNRTIGVAAGSFMAFASLLANMLLMQSSPHSLREFANSGTKVIDHKTFEAGDLALRPRARTELRGPRARLKAIQRELRRAGYAPGNTEGIRDTKTDAAILAFEYDHGLPLQAEPSSALLQALVLGLPRNPGLSPTGASTSARHLVQTVQASLTRLGFEVGGIDGRMGPQTRRAIQEFERRHGLQKTGRVSARLLTALASNTVARRMSMIQQ